MSLPKLKPLFDAAKMAYDHILDNKGILQTGGAAVGSYFLRIPDTSSLKREALTNLLMNLAEAKIDATDTAGENRKLIDNLAAIEIPKDGEQFRALHGILTHCGKMALGPRTNPPSTLYYEIQEHMRVLYKSTLPTTHRFFNALGEFCQAMEVHVGELLVAETQLEKQQTLEQAHQAALDKAKQEKEQLIEAHQVKLQALEQAHQTAITEAKKEGAQLIGAHQKKLQALEQTHQAALDELDETDKEREQLIGAHQKKLQAQEQTHQAALDKAKQEKEAQAKKLEALDISLKATLGESQAAQATLKQVMQEMDKLSKAMIAASREAKEDREKIQTQLIQTQGELAELKRKALAELQLASKGPQACKQMMAQSPRPPDTSFAGSGFGFNDSVSPATRKASGPPSQLPAAAVSAAAPASAAATPKG